MHRAETDRNITPTPQQASGNVVSREAAAEAHGLPSSAPETLGVSGKRQDLEAASSASERAVPAGTDSVVIGNSAVGIGGRWDTFQSRLRERRKEVVARCNTCSGETAVKRGSESVETLRKAV
jgi:hypothetical protein